MTPTELIYEVYKLLGECLVTPPLAKAKKLIEDELCLKVGDNYPNNILLRLLEVEKNLFALPRQERLNPVLELYEKTAEADRSDPRPFPHFRSTVHRFGNNGPLCGMYKKNICPFVLQVTWDWGKVTCKKCLAKRSTPSQYKKRSPRIVKPSRHNPLYDFVSLKEKP